VKSLQELARKGDLHQKKLSRKSPFYRMKKDRGCIGKLLGCYSLAMRQQMAFRIEARPCHSKDFCCHIWWQAHSSSKRSP
jgi:hypothetical protein